MEEGVCSRRRSSCTGTSGSLSRSLWTPCLQLPRQGQQVWAPVPRSSSCSQAPACPAAPASSAASLHPTLRRGAVEKIVGGGVSIPACPWPIPGAQQHPLVVTCRDTRHPCQEVPCAGLSRLLQRCPIRVHTTAGPVHWANKVSLGSTTQLRGGPLGWPIAVHVSLSLSLYLTPPRVLLGVQVPVPLLLWSIILWVLLSRAPPLPSLHPFPVPILLQLPFPMFRVCPGLAAGAVPALRPLSDHRPLATTGSWVLPAQPSDSPFLRGPHQTHLPSTLTSTALCLSARHAWVSQQPLPWSPSPAPMGPT